MRGFLELTWMEIKLFVREWQAVFFTFIFMPMLLFIFGTISTNEPGASGFCSVDFLVPGYIAMGIASNACFTIGGVLAAYRERGILRRFKVTPLRPEGVLVAQILVAFLMTVLSALILIMLASFSFGLRIAGDALTIIAAFCIGALSFFSFGFLLGGLFTTARVSYSVNTTIFFPMIFLSGAVFPLQAAGVPPILVNISKFIPLTYVVNLLRSAWLGMGLAPNGNWGDILFLGTFFVLCTILSAKLFKWD